MSLAGTLGKVAMGIIVAKGIGKMMGGSRGGSGGGLGDLLGGLTGGSSGSSSNNSGGLGDLLGGLAGKKGGGGLGGILDSLGGGSKLGESQNRDSGGFGDLFNSSLQGKAVSATDAQEKEAEVLLRAMINAAKSDGKLDDAEKKKITDNLGDISNDEARFVQEELSAPLDVKSFVNSVPRGLEEQVYLMSLFAIDLDTNEEAHYLDQLAKGLNLSHQTCNQIHKKLGAPALYA